MNVFRKFWRWLAVWHNTLVFRRRHPELYKQVCWLADAPDEDFVEVSFPGSSPRILIHKDSIERLRQLGEDNNA